MQLMSRYGNMMNRAASSYRAKSDESRTPKCAVLSDSASHIAVLRHTGRCLESRWLARRKNGGLSFSFDHQIELYHSYTALWDSARFCQNTRSWTLTATRIKSEVLFGITFSSESSLVTQLIPGAERTCASVYFSRAVWQQFSFRPKPITTSYCSPRVETDRSCTDQLL